jgi:hypothetical protein
VKTKHSGVVLAFEREFNFGRVRFGDTELTFQANILESDMGGLEAGTLVEVEVRRSLLTGASHVVGLRIARELCTLRLGALVLELASDDGHRWNASLDGKPLAMRLRRTKSINMNSGFETSSTEWQSVAVLPLGRLTLEGCSPELRAGVWSVRPASRGGTVGYAYNTSVYQNTAATLEVHADAARIDVTLREYTDLAD